MMLLAIWLIIGIVLFCGCFTGKTPEVWFVFGGWALITIIPVIIGIVTAVKSDREKAKAEEDRRLAEAYRKQKQQELIEQQRKAKQEATENQIELCKKYGMSVLDEMTGVEFENFLSEVLQRIGYNTSTTRTSGDFGVDIVAERDGTKYAIQCKHYTTGSVGIRSVQEVYAGRTFYEADYCVVATNAKFTDAAKELAGKTNVILWDGEKLVKILKQNTICA